jgi:hypothetical protein
MDYYTIQNAPTDTLTLHVAYVIIMAAVPLQWVEVVHLALKIYI